MLTELMQPVRKHLDYDETKNELIKRALTKFFDELGFIYKDFILGFKIDDEEKKIKVYVDIDKFENIPLLKGGKLLTIFQQMSDRLPPNVEGMPYDWMFIKQGRKHASVEIGIIKELFKKLGSMKMIGAVEMGLLNEALARLGDSAMKYGGIEILLALDFVREITKSINYTQEEKIKQLERELSSKEMFAPYHTF